MWTVQRGWFVYEEEARRELEKKYGSAYLRKEPT